MGIKKQKLLIKNKLFVLLLTSMSLFEVKAQTDSISYRNEVLKIKNQIGVERSYNIHIPNYSIDKVVNCDSILYIISPIVRDRWVVDYLLRKFIIKKDTIVQINKFYLYNEPTIPTRFDVKFNDKKQICYNKKTENSDINYCVNIELISQDLIEKINKNIKSMDIITKIK